MIGDKNYGGTIMRVLPTCFGRLYDKEALECVGSKEREKCVVSESCAVRHTEKNKKIEPNTRALIVLH